MRPGDDAGRSAAFVQRMATALEPASATFLQRATHHGPGVGLGRVGLEGCGSGAEIAWSADGAMCLVMEGEIYNQADVERAVSGDAAAHEAAPAHVLLRLYERFGAGGLDRLNGAFIAAVWDRREDQLAVFNDRLGLFPLYYAAVDDALLFASGVRALLVEPRLDRTVDRIAINQFLLYDHVLDDRTLLRSVRLLPQGSVLTFRRGELSVRPYWSLRYPELYRPRSEQAYVEGLRHHLQQAADRQRPDGHPSAVLLSGGLDSRLLLALLPNDGSIGTLTFGIPGCDDARVAARIARLRGTRHRFLELKPDWLLHQADEAVRVTDGLGNLVNLHVLATIEEQSRHARVLYKGFMGDALLGFAVRREMWADYAPEDALSVHRGVHRYFGALNYERVDQPRVFTSAFLSEVGDAAIETYRDGMTRAGSRQIATERLYFDLTQRVPRMTLNGVEAARTRAVVRLPFCDNDLLDFALSVPPGFLLDRYLPKEVLVTHFPQLAKIPIAGTGRALRPCAEDLGVQAHELLSWHLHRAGLPWMARRKPRPYKNYNEWFRTLLRPWVEGTLLDPRSLDRGYFRPEYVRQVVADHMGGANHAVRLGALLTVELWHRQFLD